MPNASVVIEMPKVEEMPKNGEFKNDEIVSSMPSSSDKMPTPADKDMPTPADNPVPSTPHSFIEMPKVEEAPPTEIQTSTSNDEMPPLQKPINEVEASIGFFGAGLFQDLKDSVASFLGSLKKSAKSTDNDNVVLQNEFVENISAITKPYLQISPNLESYATDKEANDQPLETVITDKCHPETSEMPVKNDAKIDGKLFEPMNSDSALSTDKNYGEKIEQSFEAPIFAEENNLPPPPPIFSENHFDTKSEIENAKVDAKKEIVDNFKDDAMVEKIMV
uniref:Uncharacterized protein n=1 Tax=Panagrolaimus superbus TaxID=310955 RepID=A0A914XXK8_9BILA